MLVNLSTGFPASYNHCRVFCNLADSSSVKTNQESMIFTDKKKDYTHVAIHIRAFRRKQKKLILFSRNKKVKPL